MRAAKVVKTLKGLKKATQPLTFAQSESIAEYIKNHKALDNEYLGTALLINNSIAALKALDNDRKLGIDVMVWFKLEPKITQLLRLLQDAQDSLTDNRGLHETELLKQIQEVVNG